MELQPICFFDSEKTGGNLACGPPSSVVDGGVVDVGGGGGVVNALFVVGDFLFV